MNLLIKTKLFFLFTDNVNYHNLHDVNRIPPRGDRRVMLHKNKLNENTSTCCYLLWGIGIKVMMFNTTFSNISDILWRSVLLVKETGEYHDLSLVPAKLYHIILYLVHIAWAGLELTTSVLIGTDCKGSCKSMLISCVLKKITTNDITQIFVLSCACRYWYWMLYLSLYHCNALVYENN